MINKVREVAATKVIAVGARPYPDHRSGKIPKLELSNDATSRIKVESKGRRVCAVVIGNGKIKKVD